MAFLNLQIAKQWKIAMKIEENVEKVLWNCRDDINLHRRNNKRLQKAIIECLYNCKMKVKTLN